jgi:probable O-glycosylation ligase (exosortase A-associated)
MARSLYITLVYIAFLTLGALAPFVLSLGYVWVDTFDPQDVVYYFLNQIPDSMVMAVAAFGGFILVDRNKGRLTVLTLLLAAFAAWVTITTVAFAEVPVFAWDKWNYAFKTICFAAFIPFVFRSRVQIEAFLLIYIFSLCVHILPIGIKTMISGGGYGRALGVLHENSLLAEGSTLCGVALMTVPILLYLRKHGLIVPRTRWTRLAYIGLAVTAVAAAMGTYERTGLVGMGVVGLGLWVRSRRKILWGALGIAGALTIASLTSNAYSSRISTIQDYKTEGSAYARILVWKWTLGYVAKHPAGGGFNAYRIDVIDLPVGEDGKPEIRRGVAFHSVYFEVLGEQGWPGLALFLSIIAWTVFGQHRVMRMARGVPEAEWAADMAAALQLAMATLLACGAFIGIAFQPMLYFLFAISACLREHVLVLKRRGLLERTDPAPRRTRKGAPRQEPAEAW